MISYCPLEEDYTTMAVPRAKKQVLVQEQEQGLLEGENTECNYLVLFFILGVMILCGTTAYPNGSV